MNLIATTKKMTWDDLRENNAYQLHAFEERAGKITSRVIQGFELDIKDVF